MPCNLFLNNNPIGKNNQIEGKIMKTIEQLKSEIYHEVETSGYLKNISSQIKSHVLEVLFI